MHTSNTDVQALKNPAPHFTNHENVARTISLSSLELADMVGKA